MRLFKLLLLLPFLPFIFIIGTFRMAYDVGMMKRQFKREAKRRRDAEFETMALEILTEERADPP